MESKDYLAYLVEEIHTTVVATVDDAGLPVTAAIDMMDADEGGVYFLTARGKGFYDRLKKRGVLALTGMKGEDTMHCAALSIRGKVRELESELLPRLFEKNPYMNEIYPDAASRSALTVFVIYEGSGEWFDLSKKPIERASFTFGGAEKVQEGYFITDACIVESSRGSRALYRLQALLFQMSAKVYRYFCETCGHSAEKLPALRQLL